jgi:hypothetical protein
MVARVLVACEFSGKVREAFRKLGHDAYSCDLIESSDKSPYHFQGDALSLLEQHWDLLIAHPPCTYLSNAGARHLYKGGELQQERFEKGLEAKKFFMKLYTANVDKVCIENPTPSKVYQLPLHTQVVQPYQFGHPFSKRTLLWLKNLPQLKHTNVVKCEESTKVVGNWFNKGGKDRQKNRAETFQGIADAMAEQWGGLL